jgi:dolichol-phosphate mannosyltransferase
MANVLRPLVVIPTYNERDNLRRLIPAVLAANSRLHILIVDDSSPDDTAELVRELKQNFFGPRLFLETRQGKLGLGTAYVHGMTWGLRRGYDFLIQMDGDWSHAPEDVARMIDFGRRTDFVVGSRYVPDGGTVNWGAGRRLLSKFGSFYSSLILRADFADFTGGFNGWSAETLTGMGLDTVHSDGYSFQIELKYRAHQLGYRHIEFPIVFSERRAGKSKMSAAIALEASWRVWQLKLHYSNRVRRPAPLKAAALEAAAPAATLETPESADASFQ